MPAKKIKMRIVAVHPYTEVSIDCEKRDELIHHESSTWKVRTQLHALTCSGPIHCRSVSGSTEAIHFLLSVWNLGVAGIGNPTYDLAPSIHREQPMRRNVYFLPSAHSYRQFCKHSTEFVSCSTNTDPPSTNLPFRSLTPV
jgi:hypothetical protein